MDEFSSRKTASGLFFSRKRSGLVVRDPSTERGQITPVCSRVGCSSRMSSIQNNRTSVIDKPKATKRSICSPKNGKEATASSSRTPVSPVPRKPSDPSKSLTNAFDRLSSRRQTKEASSTVSVQCSRHGKETNVSRTGTSSSSKYKLKNLKCNVLNDVDPSSASTSGSSSSSVISSSELVLGRKRTTGRKRVGEVESGLPARGKKINNDTNHGISINESRRTRNLSSTRNEGVTSVRTSRSSTRARINEQETESRISRTEAPSLMLPQLPHPSITLDTNASISEYLYPFRNNGNMPSLGGSSTSREDARRNNLNNIAEMLLAMETIDQDDNLTLEQLVVQETNLYLRSLASHDQYRDMRLDIDHMSYEELLELGDKMGTVSTALSEETLTKCLKKTVYKTAIDGMVQTGDDTKCSICQEEYEEGNEVGRLVVCEHGYHSDCIQRWLKLKNWCPICKSSAAPP
ncbi:hypothetical protein V2J09_010784 [Rumex salicifolius]